MNRKNEELQSPTQKNTQSERPGAVADAEQRLNDELNRSGIVVDPDTLRLMVHRTQGSGASDAGQLRKLATALWALADAYDAPGIDVTERLPVADDADSNGFVEWYRSGFWLRGPYTDGPPVDSSHWRRMPGSRSTTQPD